jgi:hypothetical protein
VRNYDTASDETAGKAQSANRIQRKKILASVIGPLFAHTDQTHETRGQIQRSLTLAWHLLVLYGCCTPSAWALADSLWPVCTYKSHSVPRCSHVPQDVNNISICKICDAPYTAFSLQKLEEITQCSLCKLWLYIVQNHINTKVWSLPPTFTITETE